MAHNIATATGRSKLARRRAPYYHKVQPGRFVGFRLMDGSAEGTWIAKARVNGDELFRPLGALADVPEDKRFQQALSAAGKFFAEVERTEGGDATATRSRFTYTLADAFADYVKSHRNGTEQGDEKAAYAERRLNLIAVPFTLDGKRIAEDRSNSWVLTPMVKVQGSDFAKWFKWMVALPTDPLKSGRTKHGDKRKASTINRDLNTFRAALNLAKRTYKFEDQWTDVLKPMKDEDEARGEWAYVTKADRAKLLAAAHKVAPDFVPFMTAHLIAPIRPGALSFLTVKSYDARTHIVHVGRDKANGNRKVPMPSDARTRKFFADACKSKLPSAPLFHRADGQPWDSDKWQTPMALCVAEAKLDPQITLYCLRHSRITDLVEEGVEVAAIAKLAGTSVAMIEKHYYHLREDRAREALAVAGGW